VISSHGVTLPPAVVITCSVSPTSSPTSARRSVSVRSPTRRCSETCARRISCRARRVPRYRGQLRVSTVRAVSSQSGGPVNQAASSRRPSRGGSDSIERRSPPRRARTRVASRNERSLSSASAPPIAPAPSCCGPENAPGVRAALTAGARARTTGCEARGPVVRAGDAGCGWPPPRPTAGNWPW
jgi:hypothetical protein